MKRQILINYIDERLEVKSIEDASKNGLQVQGAEEISRIGLATDAALAVYRRAADEGCQMIITHHGLIWSGIEAVTGRNYEHIKFLMDNDMSLYAAHLPLDRHPELGNNAQLSRILKLQDLKDFGYYHGIPLGFSGSLESPLSLKEMAKCFQDAIGGNPKTLDFGPRTITRVGIVSGGGSSTLEEAIDCGLDCLITGEGKHENYHLAREAGISVLYLGHYHSETLGVRALGKELEERFQLETVFIDEPTIF